MSIFNWTSHPLPHILYIATVYSTRESQKKNVQKKCKWTIDEEEGKTEKRQKQCQMPPSVPPSLFAACKIRHRRRRGSPPPFEINGCKPHGIYMGMETAAVKFGDTFATFLPDQVFQLLRCGRPKQSFFLPRRLYFSSLSDSLEAMEEEEEEAA